MSRSLDDAVRQLRHRLSADGPDGPTDAALLEAFVAGQDPDAFAVLMRRYRGLVLGVCRRILGHEQDAEDSTQATFLLLAKSARSVRRGEALPGWLHGTARRVALKALRESSRRRARGGRSTPPAAADPVVELSWREVREALDEEIARLAVIYRSAFLLCCLEGISHAEAGARLGIAEGSVSSRVTRARRQLHERLTRRGLDLSAVLAAATVGSAGLAAAASAHQARAILAHVAGSAHASGLSPTVLTLAEGASRTMTTKLRLVLVLFVAASALGAGLLLAAGRPRGAAEPLPAEEPAPKADFTYRGKVLDGNGKPLKGARVYLDYPIANGRRSLTQRAVSGDDGRFVFSMRKADFDTGRYPEPWNWALVLATAPGHGPVWAVAARPEE